jgi:hypothetical protein
VLRAGFGEGGMGTSTNMVSGIRAWFRNLLRGSQTTHQASPPARQSPPRLDDATPREPFPGNFYLFEVFIAIMLDRNEHLGYPKQPIRDTGKSPPVVRWGSRIDLMYPKDATSRVRWIDDSRNGLSTRPHNAPEDWLGAEGMVGDKRFRFERILDMGKNQVVFSLFNPELGIRIAYGFDRKVFAPKAS